MNDRQSRADFEQALQEASRRFSEGGVTLSAAELEAALVRELGADWVRDFSWTADIIVHHLLHVDFGPDKQSV